VIIVSTLLMAIELPSGSRHVIPRAEIASFICRRTVRELSTRGKCIPGAQPASTDCRAFRFHFSVL
jgi:hypothetical protein